MEWLAVANWAREVLGTFNADSLPVKNLTMRQVKAETIYDRVPCAFYVDLRAREIWRDRAISGRRPTATIASAAVEASVSRSSEARV